MQAMENTGFCLRMLLARLGRDETGVIAVMFALMLPLVLAGIGMGVEVGNWYAAKRELQSAADTAALAGAIEKYNGSGGGTITSEATTEAQRNGFTTSGGGTIAVNVPPTSGSYTADSLAVEVKLTKPISTMFVKYLMSQSSVTATGRAVAKMKSQSGNACVLALNTSLGDSINITGSTNINAANCDVATNSSHSQAFSVSGSVNVTAECFYSAGGYSRSGSASIVSTSCGAVQTNAKRFADPYEDIDLPTYSTSCDGSHTNYHHSGSGTQNISPGVYCGGIQFSGSGTLNLAAGTYILHEGDLKLSGSGTFNATGGVTIILAGSSSGNVGDLEISGSTGINWTAPTTGTYKGLMVYQGRDAGSGTNQFTGSSTLNITGAIYTPARMLKFAGSSGSGTNCVQLIGDTVKFTGSSGFNGNNCSSAGVTMAGQVAPMLVE